MQYFANLCTILLGGVMMGMAFQPVTRALLDYSFGEYGMYLVWGVVFIAFKAVINRDRYDAWYLLIWHFALSLGMWFYGCNSGSIVLGLITILYALQLLIWKT